jgi:hypothetical protein
MPVKCESCGHEHADWIPASRLSDATSKRKEAEAAKAAADARIAELEAAATAADELQAQIAALTGERDKLQSRSAIMQAGITDPEGIGVVEALWAAMAEDARPSEGLAGWLTSPDDLPRAVRAYLPQPVIEGGTPAPAAAVPPPAKAPGTSGVKPGAPSAAPQPTAAQIEAMTLEQYKAWKADGGVSNVIDSLSAARGGQAR